MYPWSTVLRDLEVFAFAEIGFFLTVLGLGILYAWREGAPAFATRSSSSTRRTSPTC